jgi:hypothetical protein
VLCLEGTPAADIVGATSDFWTRVLWNDARREWHMDLDVPCIRDGFAKMANNCHRWPAPAKFWESLPDRKPLTDRALPAKVFTLDERRRNMDRLAAEGRALLGIDKPAPAADTPKREWDSIPHTAAPGEEQAS